MRLITTDQMRLIELKDVEEGRFSLDDLAVLGAIALQNKVVQDKPDSVLILAGENSNGNYGFLLASLLTQNTAIKCEIVYLGNEDNRYLDLVRKQRIPTFLQLRDIKEAIENNTYLIDCLDGCELNQMITYPETYIIDLVNKTENYVVSCDVPSGLDGNDGSIYGSCVQADCTIALQLPKVGCFLKPGSDYVGQLIVEPIGLSYDAISLANSPFYSLDDNSLEALTSEYNTHKTLVCCGANDSTNKILISIEAMMQSGVSDVTLFANESICKIASERMLQLDTITISSDYRNCIDMLDLDDYDSVVLSCQGSLQKDYLHLVHKILKSNKKVIMLFESNNYLSECQSLLKREEETILIMNQENYRKAFGWQQSTLLEDFRTILNNYKSLSILLLQQYPICIGKDKIVFALNPFVSKAGFKEALAGVTIGLACQYNLNLNNALIYYLKAIEHYCKQRKVSNLKYEELLELMILEMNK